MTTRLRRAACHVQTGSFPLRQPVPRDLPRSARSCLLLLIGARRRLLCGVGGRIVAGVAAGGDCARREPGAQSVAVRRLHPPLVVARLSCVGPPFANVLVPCVIETLSRHSGVSRAVSRLGDAVSRESPVDGIDPPGESMGRRIARGSPIGPVPTQRRRQTQKLPQERRPRRRTSQTASSLARRKSPRVESLRNALQSRLKRARRRRVDVEWLVGLKDDSRQRDPTCCPAGTSLLRGVSRRTGPPPLALIDRLPWRRRSSYLARIQNGAVIKLLLRMRA